MIWLLRHAKAADGHPDAERPLTARGRREAAAVAQALLRLQIQLDTCLASPKRRTLETARIVCGPLALAIREEPALAGARYDAELLAAGLGETLLVGHNPAISEAVRRLCGANVHLRPGALAAIDDGRLTLLLDPAQIATLIAATPPADPPESI